LYQAKITTFETCNCEEQNLYCICGVQNAFMNDTNGMHLLKTSSLATR
jgi:hypothetical protein